MLKGAEAVRAAGGWVVETNDRILKANTGEINEMHYIVAVVNAFQRGE